MSNPGQLSGPRLGIIISMFPELHETFILRELVALERRGIDFDIFSLQHPRDPITLEDALRLSEERTFYSGLITWQTLGATLRALATHPVNVIKSVCTVILKGRDRPGEVVKNLAILPLTLHMGAQGHARGIRHWHGHWANVPTTACWYLHKIYGDSWSAAIHGEDIFSPNRFLSCKLDAARFTVVCSGYFCNHLQTALNLDAPERVHLNYHGLDPRVLRRASEVSAAQPDDKRTTRLVSIGRLVPTKGHDCLILAVDRLVKRGYSVQLDIVGSGPIEGDLRALIQEHDLSDTIQLRGAMAFDAVLDTLQSADVFCLAPRMIPGHPPDGIPNVLAEAMALKVPVVTTRVSAIPELVTHDECGLLVDVDDAPGFADAVARLLDDPDLAERFRLAAARRVGELFDQNKNIDELLGYFQQYLPSANPANVVLQPEKLQ